MNQNLLNKRIGFEKNVELEGILNSSDDWDIGYSVEIDLNNLNYIKTKQKNLIGPLNKKKH